MHETIRVALALSLCAGVARAAELPDSLRPILERKAGLGLTRFPIGFWSYTNLAEHARYMDEAEVQEWADAGFTVTMSPTFDAGDEEQVAHMRRLLDWAEGRGMKLIVEDPRTFGPRTNELPVDQEERIAAAVAAFADHPAVFGFHIGDEPGTENGAAYFETYRRVKQAAPELHPFMNLLPWYEGVTERVGYETWPAYLDDVVAKGGVDFLCYDCYSQMTTPNPGLGMYFRNLAEYREAGWRNGVPFWTTLLSVGHMGYRCPSYDELRWQFNTAVCAGASGIEWFFYYMRQPHANYRLSPVDEHWDRTETYYDLRRIHLSFHRFYGDLFSRLVCTGVWFVPEGPQGNGATFAPNELLAGVSAGNPSGPLMVGQFADAAGQRYVMLVNSSMTDSCLATLVFPGSDVRIFSWDWSGQEREGPAYCVADEARTDAGYSVRHWLAPGQEAVYRVDSEAIRAAPITVQSGQ